MGVFDDPQIPIWSFAWWLHAIEHGQNPLVTHAVWAPSGLDLVWVNTVPALSVVFAPLTALIGPVASFDVAAVLLPALSAFTAFLLCRHLTGRFWPSLVGGYLFGFSDYELQHVLGQPQLTAAFVVPLIALAIVRGFDGAISKRRLAIELGLLLGLQLYLATEIALTATIMLAAALAGRFALTPSRRRDVGALVKPVAGGYLIARSSPLRFSTTRSATSSRERSSRRPSTPQTSSTSSSRPTSRRLRSAGRTRSRAGLPGSRSRRET